MDTKKLKINIPEGYEVDKEKSTFEEIVFKKVEDPFTKLPKTWREYRNCTIGYASCFWDSSLGSPSISSFSGVYNEFSTEERVKQYVALGKLIQLRDYWTNNWKSDGNSFIVYTARTHSNSIRVGMCLGTNYPLAFPTEQMAEKFKDCFNGLLIEASPLL